MANLFGLLIAFCLVIGFWAFAGTAGYKTVTGDPTPIQSTTKQLGEQIKRLRQLTAKEVLAVSPSPSLRRIP